MFSIELFGVCPLHGEMLLPLSCAAMRPSFTNKKWSIWLNLWPPTALLKTPEIVQQSIPVVGSSRKISRGCLKSLIIMRRLFCPRKPVYLILKSLIPCFRNHQYRYLLIDSYNASNTKSPLSNHQSYLLVASYAADFGFNLGLFRPSCACDQPVFSSVLSCPIIPSERKLYLLLLLWGREHL